MPVLVLNKNYDPIRIVSFYDAVEKLYKEKAFFLDKDGNRHDWESWASRDVSHLNDEELIHGISFSIEKPKLILVTTNVYRKSPRISRENVFLRDSFVCQYCHKVFSKKELTVDHVHPKSRGGKNTWQNLTTSCKKCNSKKDDKTLHESGFNLLRHPFFPNYADLYAFYVKENEEWKRVIAFYTSRKTV